MKNIAAILIIFGMASSALAQGNDPSAAFWNSYYAGLGDNNLGVILSEQRNTEAVINEMRAQRGAPPCSIGLLGQIFQGRPAC